MRTGLAVPILCVLCVWMLALLSGSLELFWKPSSPRSRQLHVVECNPYGHGFLVSGAFTPSFGLVSPLCNLPPLPSDNWGILTDKSSLLPPHLTNKLVLLFGDSFDRFINFDFCNGVGGTWNSAMLNGTVLVRKNKSGPNHGGWPGDTFACTVERTNGAFVLVSVFHYGVSANGATHEKFSSKKHWEPFWSPPLTDERVKWLPYMLKRIAKHAFPSLCPRNSKNGEIDSVSCPDPIFRERFESDIERTFMIPEPPIWTPENPFWYPIPDMIIANSLFWDFDQILVSSGDGDLNKKTAALQQWVRKSGKTLLAPLLEVFGPSMRDKFFNFKNAETGETLRGWFPRFFLRTSPLPAPNNGWNYPLGLVHEMNSIMQSGAMWKAAKQRAFGVMDFAGLVHGNQEWRDTFHPSPLSNVIFMQHVLARLEAMESVK